MTGRPDVVPIQDLTASTIRALADRIQNWPSDFASRVDREVELDALWTLVDIARLAMRLQMGEQDVSTRSGGGDLPLGTLADLTHLADAIFTAHEAHADRRNDEAVRSLLDAAEIAQRCAPRLPMDRPA